MSFDPGLDIRAVEHPFGFELGASVFGPSPEHRRLDSIRQSLLDPTCDGPDPVYAIAMDVGRVVDRSELIGRMLLFGVVTYAAGRLGKEPVRSQGHVHRVSGHSGWSPPEIYEIWSGRAVIYMQEFAADDPGRCFAVLAEPGDIVVVPPAWAHASLSASPETAFTFGALCDREYGFEYEQVRRRRGLAWYALLNDAGELEWRRNSAYLPRELIVGPPREYRELGLKKGAPLYSQFLDDPAAVQWVSEPQRVAEIWPDFIPCLHETSLRISA